MGVARFIPANFCTLPTTAVGQSTEVTNHPARYLLNPARWKRWRSLTQAEDQAVSFDFAASGVVHAVALVDWKRHTGGGIRADWWDGSAWQTFGTFTIPADNPTRVITVWDAAGKTTQGIRVYFTNTADVNEHVEIGVVVAGTMAQPARSIDVDFEMALVDQSEIMRAVGGEMETQVRPKYHTVTGLFNGRTEADLASIRALQQSLGHGRPFLFTADHALADETLYARLVELELPRAEERGGVWRAPIELEEVL